MLTENENNVKSHLPESNPGETSDFVKNNARFAGHAEETMDSMIDGWEVETLPEFLKDEGVSIPNAEVEENISDNKPDTIDSEMDAYFGSKPGVLEDRPSETVSPMEIEKAGTCLPISSRCFFAYFVTKIIAIMDATIEDKKTEKLVQINFGTYHPFTVK